jgi:hypothetical protein
MLIGVSASGGDAVEPPHATVLVLELLADGVQIYACEVEDDGRSRWVFLGPEAALFDARGRQIGNHSKGPTWTLFDGSTVTGAMTSKKPAPEKGSIPWLLLTITSNVGSGALSNAAYIRRIDTKGGVEPAAGCDATHKGDVARMRYSATYQVFRK